MATREREERVVKIEVGMGNPSLVVDRDRVVANMGYGPALKISPISTATGGCSQMLTRCSPLDKPNYNSHLTDSEQTSYT